MQAYILEKLQTSGWKRGGEVFWTLADANSAARQMVKNRHAKGVRVLAVTVDLAAISEFPNKPPQVETAVTA